MALSFDNIIVKKGGAKVKKGIALSFERYEKKYFLTPEKLMKMQEVISEHMRADDYGEYTICNVYYDTDDWRLIRASIEKPVYKEKLRVRSYGVPSDTDSVFVELKKKLDGVVYKRRINTEMCFVEPFLYGLVEPCGGQIGREIAYFQSFYHAAPKAFIAYDRTAFAGIADSGLRVTFDRNIRWRTSRLDLRCGDGGEPLLNDDRILMEIKFPGVCPLWLSKALSENEIFPTSFSKYGTCYRENILKSQKEALFCV